MINCHHWSILWEKRAFVCNLCSVPRPTLRHFYLLIGSCCFWLLFAVWIYPPFFTSSPFITLIWLTLIWSFGFSLSLHFLLPLIAYSSPGSVSPLTAHWADRQWWTTNWLGICLIGLALLTTAPPVNGGKLSLWREALREKCSFTLSFSSFPASNWKPGTGIEY